MNLDTVLKCAEIAAAARMTSIGYVDPDIAELLDELKAKPAAEEQDLSLVTEEPVAKKTSAKKAATKEPVAE